MATKLDPNTNEWHNEIEVTIWKTNKESRTLLSDPNAKIEESLRTLSSSPNGNADELSRIFISSPNENIDAVSCVIGLIKGLAGMRDDKELWAEESEIEWKDVEDLMVVHKWAPEGYKYGENQLESAAGRGTRFFKWLFKVILVERIQVTLKIELYTIRSGKAVAESLTLSHNFFGGSSWKGWLKRTKKGVEDFRYRPSPEIKEVVAAQRTSAVSADRATVNKE